MTELKQQQAMTTLYSCFSSHAFLHYSRNDIYGFGMKEQMFFRYSFDSIFISIANHEMTHFASNKIGHEPYSIKEEQRLSQK
jgi:hypothetical protein